jgi:hypothetical protein
MADKHTKFTEAAGRHRYLDVLVNDILFRGNNF